MAENFSARFKKALDMRAMTASELSEKTGVSKSAISQYLSGAFKPRQDRTFLLAQALCVDAAWLMGYDVSTEQRIGQREININSFDHITPLKTKRVPLLGSIACGEPIFANEEHGEFVLTSDNIDADFCLRAQGDSMSGARIFDGDIVFIRQQDEVENGQIAAVMIGDEATLKRVYYYPEKSKLILNPENPAYEPLVYVGAELEEIRILGRAVAFQSVIR